MLVECLVYLKKPQKTVFFHPNACFESRPSTQIRTNQEKTVVFYQKAILMADDIQNSTKKRKKQR